MIQPYFTSPEAVPPEIQALPKVNLHSHMEGCVRVQTAIELARRGANPGRYSPWRSDHRRFHHENGCRD